MSSASVAEVTETSVVGSTSTTVDTTTSTSTGDSTTATLTSEITSSSTVSVSSIYVTPSTTYVAASTTPSVVAVTSTITQSPANTGGTTAASVVIITSTAPPASTAIISTPSTTQAAASSTHSALSASGSGSSKSSGLSTGGTIAIAVVVPIVAIALLFCLGLFLWRRRKQRKVAEEQRKAEIEDYGLNPNQDPTLATAAYAETGSEMAEDNSGYRGWGTTSSAQRKPSTTLGSGSRGAPGAAGPAMSESSSTAGGNAYTHPPSDDMGEGAATGAFGGAAAGGAMGAVASRRRSNDRSNINRGPSNASSAYSAGGAHTDISEELPGSAPAPYYHEEGPYNYIDAQAQQGPYGDGTYHPSGQPVIRNVQARRNTKIERAPTYPNVGIAQNF